MTDAESNIWANSGLSQSTWGLMSHYCWSSSDVILVLSRRKEKRIERFPDKILGCEIQANVKWSLSICTPEKEFKAENKTQTNLNHTCWVTLGPQWNQRMLCCSTEMPASSSSWTVDKLPPPELLTNFCSDTEQTLAWQSRENTI